MTRSLDFNVEAIDTVTLKVGGELAARDLMSPYVWQIAGGKFAILVRGVPRDPGYTGDTGRIWYGEGDDGLTFMMDERPVLVPGPNPVDGGGVEDPTPVIRDGNWVVYYTGVALDRGSGALFYATGTGPFDLVKRGVGLASSKTEGNTKEATLARTPAGKWRLFYEYARDGASLIGLALGEDVTGPWTEQPQPLSPRPNLWDSWHMSTGPMLTDDPHTPVMFYNAATRDARWRIGWVAFDEDCTKVVDRCIEPLIAPPPRPDRTDADIAFAASAVVVGPRLSWLYYSVGDRALERATIRRFG